MKALIAILILVCLALSASLYFRHSKAVVKEQADTTEIIQLSNKVEETSQQLTEQKKVNADLEAIVTKRTEELLTKSNEVNQIRINLARVQEEAKAAAANAAADIKKRDERINELETQRDDLTKRMTELNSQITGLDTQISEMQRKLAASEGDREFLLKELKRLQTEKSELERQFNDIAMLREQVRKLRDELSISRRLDWIRRGLYGSLKGAERLQKGFTAPAPQQAAGTNYDLNVELKQSGGVNVQNATTNPPPATPIPQPK
jgi:chromosome segregation ATPase